MMDSARIRRDIWKKGLNELFCNRDLLVHGSRALVDKVLSTLAKKGDIIRLARGVYCRQLDPRKRPSLIEVVKFKATSFNRTIRQTVDGAAARLGLTRKGEQASHTFITNSSTSSFAIFGEEGETRVHIKKASARKMLLTDDLIDSAIKVLWSLEKPLDRTKLYQVIKKLAMTKDDEVELRRKAKVMPAWVADVVTNAIARFRP
ncbi:MAG TPA: hypothetical protein V6C69_19885 [Trichormus sp.]|jgi:hypothetical protein